MDKTEQIIQLILAKAAVARKASKGHALSSMSDDVAEAYLADELEKLAEAIRKMGAP